MNALEIKALSKVYDNGNVALSDVSLNIPKGSFFALLGPNGAGKSTLINILADTVRASGGSVHLQGHDLFAERGRCKRLLGVVPQEVAFDPFFTPREVLAFTSGLFGCKPDNEWIDELLARLELIDHSGKNTRQLSGGMRRRLLVAQALVHKPKLVILDEPTAGVDVELRRRLWDFMRELNSSGTTVLLTTHYLDEAEELCDHVAIIDHGRLITARPMQEMMAEIGSSYLWLDYGRELVLSDDMATQMARFAPRLSEHGICLKLDRSQHGSTFHQAYQAAVTAFGEPNDADMRRENLEDIFLRLTGEAASEPGGDHAAG